MTEYNAGRGIKIYFFFSVGILQNFSDFSGYEVDDAYKKPISGGFGPLDGVSGKHRFIVSITYETLFII